MELSPDALRALHAAVAHDDLQASIATDARRGLKRLKDGRALAPEQKSALLAALGSFDAALADRRDRQGTVAAARAAYRQLAGWPTLTALDGPSAAGPSPPPTASPSATLALD